MNSPTIGAINCTIEEIVSTIFDNSCPDARAINDKCVAIGITFGIDPIAREQIKTCSPVEDKFAKLLELWTSRQSNLPSVQDLIDTLRQHKLLRAAKTLEDKFCSYQIPNEVACTKETTPLNLRLSQISIQPAKQQQSRLRILTWLWQRVVLPGFSNVCKSFHEIRKNQLITVLVILLVSNLVVIGFLVSYIYFYSIGPPKCPLCEAVVVQCYPMHCPSGPAMPLAVTRNSFSDVPSALDGIKTSNVNLTLSLKDSQWNESELKLNTSKFSHLTLKGNIGLSVMFETFRLFNHVAGVIIDNESGGICDARKIPPKPLKEFTKVLTMSCLQSLILNNFKSCSNLFHLLEHNLEYPQLNLLKIYNSDIDKKSLLNLRSIMVLPRLETLEISLASSIDLEAFRLGDSTIYAKNLTIESLKGDEIYINEKFCNTFQHLEVLKMRRGFLNGKYFDLVAKCKTVEHITIALYFDDNTKLELVSETKLGPALKELNVIFSFKSCPPLDMIGRAMESLSKKVTAAFRSTDEVNLKCPLKMRGSEEIHNIGSRFK